jgi:hypothetical protein
LPDKPPSSAGDEIQTEYFVKYADLPAALEEVYKLQDKLEGLV